jgi:hypothetical protein
VLHDPKIDIEILSKLFLAKVQRMCKIQINLWSKCAAIELHLEEFGCSWSSFCRP